MDLKASTIFLFLVYFLNIPHEVHFLHCDKGKCWKGTFFDRKSENCTPCSDGTFMDENGHQCNDCLPCQKPNQQHHEVLAQPCNPESNAVIECEEGYFRRLVPHHPESDDCFKCRACGSGQILIRSCGKYDDTLCSSPRKEMVPELNSFSQSKYDDPKKSSFAGSKSETYVEDSEKIKTSSPNENRDESLCRILYLVTVLTILLVLIISTYPYKKKIACCLIAVIVTVCFTMLIIFLKIKFC